MSEAQFELETPDEPVPPIDPESSPVRPEWRRMVAVLVITSATALTLGVALRAPTNYGANDISRWCTIWSLLERGSYKIDDCPWQDQTQDKVNRADPFAEVAPGEQPAKHFYSSKPPMLPTLIAGMLYPIRAATGVPLDRIVSQARLERYVSKEVDGETVRVLETPDPVPWPTYVFYFKPIILLLNVVPFLLMLVLYARYLDRFAANDWTWLFCLVAASFGLLLLSFNQTLNNHTIAAYSAFFALYGLIAAWTREEPGVWPFVAAGFFGAFCACNELPAALFGIMLFLALVVRFPRPTALYFLPAAAVPILIFFATQYAAFGQFRPVYEEFGTESYEYEGSYWVTPLEMDWFNKHPESNAKYLFHMTLGHHGIVSLTPIFLFSLYGATRLIANRHREVPKLIGWMTLALTIALVAFYTWNPKARNYGGSTQGLRWLFWLIPFWLYALPRGVEAGQHRAAVRWACVAALGVSVMSVGYALRTPWSHPWLLDLLEHLNLYVLQR